MKKLLTTVALSLSAVMATSVAMAAGPGHDQRFDPRKAPPPPAHVVKQGPQFKHNAPPPPVHANKYKDDRRVNDNRFDDKRFNDKRQFNNSNLRVGQTLPRSYDSKRFEVNSRDARGLAKAGKNEQWYKVNGDYILVNEKNNRILRVI